MWFGIADEYDGIYSIGLHNTVTAEKINRNAMFTNPLLKKSAVDLCILKCLNPQ